jgi:signal transduction histidine kinase
MLGLISTVEGYVGQQAAGEPVPLLYAARRSFEKWYLWAAVSVGVIWLAERFPFTPRGVVRWLTIHVAGSSLAAAVWVVGLAALLHGQWSVVERKELSFALVWPKAALHYSFVIVMVYWGVIVAQHARRYYRKDRERELRTVELEKALAQARLDALRMQLNPHFLFNTLHAVSALIHSDPSGADRVVARLSELLRTSLDTSHRHEVALATELEWLQRYLEIEQIRFQERLTVRFEIEPATRDALVPCLVLQPLVENAIRHGVEAQEGPGQVVVGARRDNGVLELAVCDDGPGCATQRPGQDRNGIGIANTRSRLRHLYGEASQLVLQTAPAGGTEARVRIPFHSEPIHARGAHA